MTDLRALGDEDGGKLYYINIVHRDIAFTSVCMLFFWVGFSVIYGFTRVSLGLVQGCFGLSRVGVRLVYGFCRVSSWVYFGSWFGVYLALAWRFLIKILKGFF